MSDIHPGTMIRAKVIRRYSHYSIGDEIALDLASAQDAARRGLIVALPTMLVPTPPARVEDPPPPPIRQPGNLVRK